MVSDVKSILFISLIMFSVVEQLKNDLSLERDHYCGVKLVRGAYYNQDHQYNI